jgi:hypothetical protein
MGGKGDVTGVERWQVLQPFQGLVQVASGFDDRGDDLVLCAEH